MKYALLALLAQAPAHGYELKQAFENLFGAVQSPLNAGQIYTTLSRLERDGLVSDTAVEQDDRPNKRVYELTPAGKQAVMDWLQASVAGPRLRDEFFTKLVLAREAHIADPCDLIAQQRHHYLQDLRDMNRLLTRHQSDVVASLLIEGVILHLEADVKWLDRCEEAFSEGAQS